MATTAHHQPTSASAVSTLGKPAQGPTPERFFNAINAHQQSAALRAAIELEIFTAIDEGKTTAAGVAERCKTAERGARILCDFLTIHGFLTKDGQNYGLAPDSALFLNRHFKLEHSVRYC